MKRIIFATSNPHKLREVRTLLEGWTILDPGDAGYEKEIEETAETLEGNAILKAMTVSEAVGMQCFAEDTGLEVKALGGAPGVFSARYAGPEKDARANVEKLLNELEGISYRSAQFRTVIALADREIVETFEGVVKGRIAMYPQGKGGFGYDPVFIPSGFDRTFGELDEEVKNRISHRARAIMKLLDHLQGGK